MGLFLLKTILEANKVFIEPYDSNEAGVKKVPFIHRVNSFPIRQDLKAPYDHSDLGSPNSHKK